MSVSANLRNSTAASYVSASRLVISAAGRRHVAQEIEEQPLAVEQVLDVDQHAARRPLAQAALARLERLVPLPLQPRLQQIVLHAHPPQDLPVGAIAR